LTTLDNLGLLLASFIRPVSGASLSVGGFKGIDGVSETLGIYGLATANIYNDSGEFASTSQAQVGDSATPVTRQDFNIGNAFANGGIEDTKVANLSVGYNSGLAKIEIPTNFSPTAGAGTVREVCKFLRVGNFSGLPKTIMIFRDVVSDSAFIIGQSIDIVHEVTI
jgi:hypothetical protein